MKKEINRIMRDDEELHNEMDEIKAEYKQKQFKLE